MFVWTILKNQRGMTKVFSKKCDSLIKDRKLWRRAKLTNTQVNKLKVLAKIKTRTILKVTKKIFQVEELPRELFLTTRQKTNIRNVVANNMLTDIKLSKAHLSKIIQSVGFLGKKFSNMMVNSGKKALLDLPVHLAKDVCLNQQRK